MREVIVLHPILEKKLSLGFSKFLLVFPESLSENGLVKLGEKQFFLILGKAVLEEGEWFSDPPWGGKWY
jgi:hypothetical protein